MGYFIDFIKTKYVELNTDSGGRGEEERTPPHSLEHLWLSAHRAYSLSQWSAAIILQASNALNKRFKKANPHSSVLPSSARAETRFFMLEDSEKWRLRLRETEAGQRE